MIFYQKLLVLISEGYIIKCYRIPLLTGEIVATKSKLLIFRVRLILIDPRANQYLSKREEAFCGPGSILIRQV